MAFDKHYAKYYELLNSDKRYKEEIEFVYKWAGKPDRILDIGCGPAGYWIYFPKDVELVGIEKSKEMIANSLYKAKIRSMDASQIGEFETKTAFPCIIALFDTLGYIPTHNWWLKMPLNDNGYFIFDIWDKEKVDRDGFKTTLRRIDGLTRVITPLSYDGHKVELDISLTIAGWEEHETHTMYVWSREDIERFCGKDFIIDAMALTNKWQTWYRLKKLKANT